MQISDLKRKSQRFKLDSTDILPLAFAGLSIGVFILAIVTAWLAISFSKLANQKPPTLVQQVDGRAFTTRPAKYDYREPEVIRRTVSNWAVMTFTWGKLPGQKKIQVDTGKEVQGTRKRIPTSTWEASFLLAPDFRDAFLQKMAMDIVPDDVFRGQVAAILIPQNFSSPEVAGEGRWRIDLIATRMVFDDANPAGKTIPFNRTFYVKAIEPPQNPLGQNATEYQHIAYSMLESSLQIEDIRPLEREDLAK
ncbi:hypothetical protein ACKFKF_15170 [Phormidesmis sp. 146-12]